MKYSKQQVVWISTIAIVLVLSPIIENWADKPKDSFPLSYYPMFSKKRNATYPIYHFVGYDSDQKRYIIPYTFAGTGGFNQVRRQIKKAAKSENAYQFTQKVAERISNKKGHPYSALERIELIKGYYHLENYFLKKDTLPVHERKIAIYKIQRL
ncbi:hypothetical protein D1816_04535 [Aquimarina sp. AD10]|uniref:hypothetical protein n=1 Tax=Aquimarina sp. AD10 TaxID=1714849 RepID=UPI000E4B2D28|nr:hypothetical protein [Aquimarina sp. AD10]AXT59652.1 hypothetical protein D1816_04535 [Aquimarina sp. AD10]RKM97528.1 hypothetical protein D7033_14115 [Aquimarina sp. AD10]